MSYSVMRTEYNEFTISRVTINEITIIKILKNIKLLTPYSFQEYDWIAYNKIINDVIDIEKIYIYNYIMDIAIELKKELFDDSSFSYGSILEAFEYLKPNYTKLFFVKNYFFITAVCSDLIAIKLDLENKIAIKKYFWPIYTDVQLSWFTFNFKQNIGYILSHVDLTTKIIYHYLIKVDNNIADLVLLNNICPEDNNLPIGKKFDYENSDI